MRRDFPMSWEMWRSGVENACRLHDELQERVDAGETLSDEDAKWLEAARAVVARYKRNGRKKPRPPRHRTRRVVIGG